MTPAGRPVRPDNARQQGTAVDQKNPLRTIGRATSPFRKIVDRTKLAEYARALHLRNPIHWDREAAQRAGYRDVVAVPGFVTSLTMEQRDVKFKTFGLVESKSLLGEVKWEACRVVCAGDELRGCSVLADVTVKQGKHPMDILAIQTRLENQFGEIVMIVTETHVERKDGAP